MLFRGVCPQRFAQKILKKFLKAFMNGEMGNLYEFGEFRFDGEKHRLWENKRLILLSPKASELLQCLLEKNGEFVSKQEIFDCVWADTFVEDGVLTQNIYTLRKILGKTPAGTPLIENKTRLGYRITVPVRLIEKPGDNGSVGVEKILDAPQISMNDGVSTDESKLSRPPEKIFAYRKKLFVFACAALVLLAVAFLGYLFLRPPQAEIITRSTLESIRFQKITDTGDINFSALSPDGNLAAYKKADGVYVKDLKTQTEMRVEISNVKRFGFLQFSADSNFIFLRNRASFFLPSQIMKVSRFGGEAQAVAENVWSGFSFSPDEKQVVFTRNFPTENRQSLVVKNLANGAETEIAEVFEPEAISIANGNYPSWSADGKKIALTVYRSGSEDFLKILVVDPQTRQTEVLAVKDFQSVQQIVWHPKRLNTLIASGRRGEKNFQLWEIVYPSGDVRRITNDLNSYRLPTFSADGAKLLVAQNTFYSNIWVFDNENPVREKQVTFGTSNLDGMWGMEYLKSGEIIYSSNEGDTGDANLWLVSPNNNQKRQLMNGAGSKNEFPCPSPDDKFIFFQSNRGGKIHVWRADADGKYPQQITFGENSEEMFPQLSPDGGTLYFIRRSGKSAAVWQKSLNGGAEQPITDENELSPENFLAISPDGKYLAFQHLTEKIQADNAQQTYQIALLSLESAAKVRFFNIGGGKVAIYWMPDSKAFDYLEVSLTESKIFRQSLDENSSQQTIRVFPKERVFTIARSKDGKTHALARGQFQHDAILLTNFE